MLELSHGKQKTEFTMDDFRIGSHNFIIRACGDIFNRTNLRRVLGELAIASSVGRRIFNRRIHRWYVGCFT